MDFTQNNCPRLFETQRYLIESVRKRNNDFFVNKYFNKWFFAIKTEFQICVKKKFKVLNEYRH